MALRPDPFVHPEWTYAGHIYVASCKVVDIFLLESTYGSNPFEKPPPMIIMSTAVSMIP